MSRPGYLQLECGDWPQGGIRIDPGGGCDGDGGVTGVLAGKRGEEVVVVFCLLFNAARHLFLVKMLSRLPASSLKSLRLLGDARTNTLTSAARNVAVRASAVPRKHVQNLTSVRTARPPRFFHLWLLFWCQGA